MSPDLPEGPADEPNSEHGVRSSTVGWSLLFLVSIVAWSIMSSQERVATTGSPDAVELPERADVLYGGQREQAPATQEAASGGERGWCLAGGAGRTLFAGPHTGVALVAHATGADRVVLWQRTPEVLGGLPARPAADGDVLVVGLSTGELVALEVDDGRVRWRVAAPSGRHPAWLDGHVLLHHDGDAIVRRDDSTGRELWRAEGDPLRRSVGTPVVHDGRVFSARSREQRERFVRAPTDSVAVLDLTSGGLLAEFEILDAVRSTRPSLLDLAMSGGELVTLEKGGLIVGRDPLDGTPRWRRPIDDRATSLVGTSGGLAVLGTRGWATLEGSGDASEDPAASTAAAAGWPCHAPPSASSPGP